MFFARAQAATEKVPHLRLGDGPSSALSTIEVMIRGVAACQEWVKGAQALTSGHGLDDASSGRLVQVQYVLNSKWFYCSRAKETSWGVRRMFLCVTAVPMVESGHGRHTRG